MNTLVKENTNQIPLSIPASKVDRIIMDLKKYMAKHELGFAEATQEFIPTLRAMIRYKNAKNNKILKGFKKIQTNIVSQKVLEKFGFNFEGKLKDEFYHNKKLHSALIYGLLNKN